MPTSTKTTKNSSSARGESARRFAWPGGTSQPASRSSSRFPRAGGTSQAASPRSRFPRPGGAGQPPARRPQFPRARTKPSAEGASGLFGRAPASLPGRKSKGKRSAGLGGAAMAMFSSAGEGKDGRSRRPSRGMLGLIATAGVGAAAMVKRRRGASDEAAPVSPPVQPAPPVAAEGGPPVAAEGDPPVAAEGDPPVAAEGGPPVA
jgi:hypothetical protein